jgi:tetratricopeptide (TPR) repeat protein
MITLIYFIYICAHICVVYSSKDAGAYRTHFEEALRHYRGNNEPMCEIEMIEALKFDPLNVDANGFLGSLYLLQGRSDIGLKYLSVAVENGGSDAELLASYIEALRLGQQYDKAISIYRDSILIYPENSRLLLNGGLVYLNAGDRAAGIDCLANSAQHFDPNDQEGWIKIIENLNLMHMYDEAEIFSTVAAEKYPNDGLVLFHAGLVFHYESKFERALELYTRALELRPDIYPLRTNIGAVHQAMGNMHEAKRVYQSAYQDQKDDPGYLVRSTYSVFGSDCLFLFVRITTVHSF